MRSLLSAVVAVMFTGSACAEPVESNDSTHAEPAIFANPSQAAPTAPAFAWPPDLQGRTVLFVGAHPDDEWGVAPLLAEACLDRGARCHFVVASEARSYGCLPTLRLRDPEECSRIRRREMEQSAALFNGRVEFFGWEDLFYSFDQSGVHRTIEQWAVSAGGRDALVERFESVLRARRPAIVFTLDPRHGSTCHSGHRAVASLLVEAVRRLPEAQRPDVWLEQIDNIDERSEAVAEINRLAGYAPWPDTREATVFYDANRRLRDGRTGFDFVLAIRRLHASQYPKEAAGELIHDPPASLRWTPVASLSSLTEEDFCTPLNLRRPTLDIPENRRRLGIE